MAERPPGQTSVVPAWPPNQDSANPPSAAHPRRPTGASDLANPASSGLTPLNQIAEDGVGPRDTLGPISEQPVRRPESAFPQRLPWDSPDRLQSCSSALIHAAVISALGAGHIARAAGWLSAPEVLKWEVDLVVLCGVSSLLLLALALLNSRCGSLRPPPFLITCLHFGLATVGTKLDGATGACLCPGEQASVRWFEAAGLQVLAVCLYPASRSTWAVLSLFLFAALLGSQELQRTSQPWDLLGRVLFPAALTIAGAAAGGHGPLPGRKGTGIFKEMCLGRAVRNEAAVLDSVMQSLLQSRQKDWRSPDLQARLKETARRAAAAVALPSHLREAVQRLCAGVALNADDNGLQNQMHQATPMIRDFVQQTLEPPDHRSLSSSQRPRQSDSDRNDWMQELHRLLELTQQEPAAEGPSNKCQEVLRRRLGRWDLNLFDVSAQSFGWPLTPTALTALDCSVPALCLKAPKVRAYVEGIERLYRPDLSYHNSIHAADVVNSVCYFLGLSSSPLAKAEHIERLSVLLAAAVHDVGHNGRSNRFHVQTQSPLALLFNDQHCLENMHCAIAFAVMETRSTDFHRELAEADRRALRSNIVSMVLETDLASHGDALKRFKSTFLSEDVDEVLDSQKKKQLLSFVLKSCDVGGSSKAFHLHVQWAARVNAEFFAQGDEELALGLPCSPFCERWKTNVSESQCGFYEFIVSPLMGSLVEYLRSRRARDLLGLMQSNWDFWKTFDHREFNYEDPLGSCELLLERYEKSLMDRQPSGGEPSPKGVDRLPGSVDDQ